MTAVRRIYEICDAVLRRGCYLSEELSLSLSRDRTDAGFITAVCYGIFDRLVQLDAVLDSLLLKRPKPAVRNLLRVGCYLVRESDMPDYAAVNASVELCRELGKQAVCGMVNSVLKQAGNVALPEGDGDEALSVRYSFPLWIVRRYREEYGARAEALLSFRPGSREHIRVNPSRIDFENFCSLLSCQEVGFERSECAGCLWVDYGALMERRVDPSFYTKQNYGSVRIVDFCRVEDGMRVLDCCAAPGGKSVLIAQRNPSGSVVAGELHEHRVELIKSYCARMGANNVQPIVQDATVFREDWRKGFDCVLCDVPCSGLGVLYSKPDIKYFRKEEDIGALAKIQQEILTCSAGYVRPGGRLIYSTCTLLCEENEQQVRAFMKRHDGFELEEEMKLLPFEGGHEGFYAARMIRNK